MLIFVLFGDLSGIQMMMIMTFFPQDLTPGGVPLPYCPPFAYCTILNQGTAQGGSIGDKIVEI